MSQQAQEIRAQREQYQRRRAERIQAQQRKRSVQRKLYDDLLRVNGYAW